MKRYALFGIFLVSFFLGSVSVSHAQSITPGWDYSETGEPRYYYANGAYYDPLTQSYGGTVLYPEADGPSLSSEAFTPEIFTPGVPNTGTGGRGLTVLLALLVSGGAAILGTYYLNRAHLI